MRSRKVIVFGATGEIGGRIASGCVKAGHQVFGVSRGVNARDIVDLAGVRMIHGDKSDEKFVRELAELDGNLCPAPSVSGRRDASLA